MALDTIPDLLAAVEHLPSDERRQARARVAAAVELPAPAARAALGMLALDLAPATDPPAPVTDEPDLVVDLRDPVAVPADAAVPAGTPTAAAPART